MWKTFDTNQKTSIILNRSKGVLFYFLGKDNEEKFFKGEKIMPLEMEGFISARGEGKINTREILRFLQGNGIDHPADKKLKDFLLRSSSSVVDVKVEGAKRPLVCFCIPGKAEVNGCSFCLPACRIKFEEPLQIFS